MAEYELEKPRSGTVLELKRVDEKEFYRNLKSLDNKGKFPLALAAGKEYGLFVENGNVIGYVQGSNELSRVDGFAIHQDYRGKGYGKLAIEQLKTTVKKNGNSLVVCAFPTAYKFFQKCGLAMVDHEPGEVWLADV